MILSLRNIGRFYKEARMEINGITIVAGENGTGKSTIGKTLYCTFNSLYNINDKTHRSRIDSIRARLYNAAMVLKKNASRASVETARRIVEECENSISKEHIRDVLDNSDYPYEDLDEQDKQKLLEEIEIVLKTDEKSIVRYIVERNFAEKFGGLLQHANHIDEVGVISATIRGSSIVFEDHYGAEFIVSEYMPLKKDIIYINDEFSLENNMLNYRYDQPDSSLHEKIVLRKKENEDVVGDLLYEEKYKKIIDKINQENIGDLIAGNGKDFEYKEKGLNINVSIENVSSGTKIMVLIKQLIKNGYLEDNGIIVLDEPEIHLHPKWQKLLAEIIVLMRVEFNINILISTHSSDFLAFIRYYSRKYKIDDENKAYLIVRGEEEYTSEIIDVTGNIDEVYKMLGEPFIRVSEELGYEA